MIEFDAYAPEFVADPYPTYARLRAESPRFHDERWGVTFFALHSDVRAMLRDRRFGRSPDHAVPRAELAEAVLARERPSEYPAWTKFIRGTFMDMEPPDHTRLRRLVQAAFSRRASESYRHRLETTADALVDRALEKGTIDAVADYATPIPLAMIGELMGVPASDQMQLVDWSTAIVRLFDQQTTPEEGEAAETATREFVDYLTALIEDRRNDPGDDLLSALIDAEVEGDRLTDEQIIATSILAINAGHEATVQAIGNGLLALARDQDQYDLLRSQRVPIAGVVDELLRFDTPLQMFERWVLADTDWHGVELRRGSKIGLLFGSANHDESVFDAPERLDLERRDNPHVSFGGGVHYCVGAPLARVELEAAFSRFAQRVSSFELTVDEPDRTPSLVFRGVSTLPITVQ